MLALLALLLQTGAVVSAETDSETTVVVTAPSQSLREALDHCVKRGCPPRQDIIVAIRYAEVQFRSGRYYDARRILQDAIARDRSAAAAEPVALAALYEATTTVALHDGEQDVARRASGNRLSVLRNSFGKDDPRYLQATLDDVDLQARLGRPDDAQARYAVLERRARETGQPAMVAATAMRRAAWANAGGDMMRAAKELARVIADPQQDDLTRSVAAAMQASFKHERGSVSANTQSTAEQAIASEPGPLRWVDLGFQIRPDGTVGAPAVLRGTRGVEWARPIQAAIAARRYVATQFLPNERYRVERWTLTADYCAPKGSLVRRRGCRPHYVETDLTSTVPTTIRRSQDFDPASRTRDHPRNE